MDCLTLDSESLRTVADSLDGLDDGRITTEDPSICFQIFSSGSDVDNMPVVGQHSSPFRVSLLRQLEQLATSAATITDAQARTACALAHGVVWNQWMALPLAEQKADILTYLQKYAEPHLVLRRWWLRPPLNDWAPLAIRREDRQSASINMTALVDVLWQAFLKDTNSDSLTFAEPLIVQILLCIKQNYTDVSFGVAMVAGEIGLSERQVARLLKTHTGMSFTEYVRYLRIEKAKALLKTTNEGIKGVCWKVGYSETRWFTRYFYSNTGLTPGQFRRQSR